MALGTLSSSSSIIKRAPCDFVSSYAHIYCPKESHDDNSSLQQSTAQQLRPDLLRRYTRS